ncbi:MAG: histidine phosphatase family protein [Solirubrobacteraceae bacterium]
MAERAFIVRHGETEWSARSQHTSHTDLSLTEAGRKAATALRSRLASESFELVLCSPMRRARETCELAGFSDVAELCRDLVEWDYGRYEGLTTPQIHEQDPDWNLWRDGCPDGESPEDVGARVDRVHSRLAAVDGVALCFAHGHVLRVLTARWLEMEVSAGARFKLAAAGVGVLGYERATRVLDSWSV